jgi:hypothetical protein
MGLNSLAFSTRPPRKTFSLTSSKAYFAIETVKIRKVFENTQSQKRFGVSDDKQVV